MTDAIIIDYDAGNLRSVLRACREVGLDAEISRDAEAVRRAKRIIFPGVGAAGSGMKSIRASGIDKALAHAHGQGTPILGICLGLQISLNHSEENDTETLGLVPGTVNRFVLDNPALKIPHMGWNEVEVVRQHPVLAGTEPGDEFYFVHAYYPRPSVAADVLAESEYEGRFCSALGRGSLIATQFHPEKSGRAGLRLLSRFAEWDGRA